jgi:hypothetical protein
VRDVTEPRPPVEESDQAGQFLSEGADSVTLVGGSLIFGVFLVLFLLAVIHGLYSRSGSGIAQRPYRDAYGDAPGAHIPSSLGRDVVRQVTRGTR